MINRNNADNWSTRKENGIRNVPTLIKSKKFTTAGVKPSALTSKNIRRLIIKDASTTPQPMMPETDLERFFLNRPFSKKPINGSSGIKYTSLIISSP